MSKFVAFFISLGLFSAHVAWAQSETSQESTPQVESQPQEENFEKLLSDAGISAFRQLKTANKECVSKSVAGKTIGMLVPMAVSAALGSHLGVRDELKASQKFVDTIIQSDMHSTNKIYELGKAGSATPQAQKFPRGRTSRWLTRAGWALLIAYATEQGYYWVTGKDFFTSSTLNEYMRWVRDRLSRPTSSKELAAYYATQQGFQEFLRLTDEEDVKMLMKENPVLGAGTIAITQLVQVAGCTPVKYFGPENLDEDSKKMMTRPSKVKGEEL